MEQNNLSDLGRQIGDAVQRAVQSGDFTRLKNTVSRTMHTVIHETIGHNTGGPAARGVPPQQPPRAPVNPAPQPAPPVRYPPAAPKKAYSRNVGLAMKIFGVLGLLFFGGGTLSAGLSMLAGNQIASQAVMLGFMLPPTAFFGFLTVRGFQKSGRAGRHRLYCAMLEEKGFCEVKALAGAARKSPAFVAKELRTLLLQGKLPGARMNEEQTYLFGGEEVYRQYLAVQEKMKQVEPSGQEDTGALSAVLSFGHDCIRQIREANDALPGEAISQKLDRLEEITAKIFAYVGQRPEKLPQIRGFMDYYLPTTLKLVNSYRELEAQDLALPNVIRARAEIEEILDTIHTAFLTLFDGLYQDEALDISSDIAAMKTLLAQEGLMGSDFQRD